jgi:hypothetical protein
MLFLQYYKKYKKRVEREKKLLGDKKGNFEFIKISEEDFKISLNDIKDLEDIGEG